MSLNLLNWLYFIFRFLKWSESGEDTLKISGRQKFKTQYKNVFIMEERFKKKSGIRKVDIWNIWNSEKTHRTERETPENMSKSFSFYIHFSYYFVVFVQVMEIDDRKTEMRQTTFTWNKTLRTHKFQLTCIFFFSSSISLVITNYLTFFPSSHEISSLWISRISS